ncbi:MAG: M20/M25/M40 family metallo-hydrolase [Candidatus Zhuqueibacterota bacterium]
MKFKQIVLSIFLVALVLNPLYAQKTAIKVDGDVVKSYITHMADDKFLGRKPLTPEMHVTQEWAKNLFANWGLEPAGENGAYFQAVPIEGRRSGYTVSKGTPKMVIDRREFFTKFNDFTVDPRSATGKKLKGEIVFAGYGISAPGKQLDEYANLDVKGKFVLVLKGSPNDVDAPRGYFSPQEEAKDAPVDWEPESLDSSKIQTAYQKGAVGILFYNPKSEEDFRSGREPLRKSGFQRAFIIVPEISKSVFQWIMWGDDQESVSGFEGRINRMQLQIKDKKPQSFATGKVAAIKGFDSTDFYGENFNNFKCRNIIGKITGTDPALKDEYIVLGGHFDHLGVTNGQVFNGADDNASGSAVVMEVARLMKLHKVQLKRTVYFCLWTAEELGLIGSQYWVDHPTDGVTLDKVVANFNMDMVGLGETISAGGGLNFPSVWDIIARDQDEDIINVVTPRTGGPGGSDHSAFIQLGIESVFLITGGGVGHPDYHDTGDDAEKIDPEILRKTTQFVLQATINLGQTAETLVIQDRQQLYDGLLWNMAVINPGLKARGGWTQLEAGAPDDLARLMMNKVSEKKNPQPTQRRQRFFRGGSRSNISTGLAGAQLFNFDVNYMLVAQKTLEFGRLDVAGDDGRWFDKGLTECGAKALKTMQDSSIVLHLIRPSQETLSSVLQNAEKPFIISGVTEFDSNQLALINEKKVVVTLDLDPKNTDKFIADLNALTAALGDKDNIIINALSEDSLDAAKQAVYMKLFKDGWTKQDIYAIGGASPERGGSGNLSPFMPRRDRRWF